MTLWRYAASSDVGLVREVNEDDVFVDDRLAVVADGMGGHAAGEVASQLAVRTIVDAFDTTSTTEGLESALELANDAIISDAESHEERRGMGTTAVVLALTQGEGGVLPVIANVGDSRAYQLRDGAMRQITADHSVAEEWVRQGRLTPEEAAVHPRRHQLTRTLGIEHGVRVDLFPIATQPGDRVLLCSDGLSNELTDAEIAELASPPVGLDEAVAALVEAANRRGGRDNISVVLVELDEQLELPPPEPLPSLEQPAAATAAKVRPARKSRITWRAGLFAVALIGSLAGAYAVLDWYAGSTFYIQADRATPTSPAFLDVYRGQPGGILWFKPSFVIGTGIRLDQIPIYDRGMVDNGNVIEQPSDAAAITYVESLHQQFIRQSSVPTTTTTSTTLAGGSH